LHKRKTKPLHAERKAIHEAEDIEAHFRRFEAAKKEYNIKDENIYNADETGWRVGCLNGRVVFTFPDVLAVYMASLETRESVTSIECISATGSYIPGFLILPGQLLLEGQFDNDIHPDCIFATNKETGSGFINDILAIDWLEHFELHTRPGTKTRKGVIHNGEWRMLILDGHGSHLTIEFMDYCWDNKIIPFLLPPHLTHLLQPCDVGIFQPMKRHHQNILAEQIRFGGADDYCSKDFLDAYNEISVRTMKRSTIKHAFAKAGLIPFSPKIVLERMEKIEGPRKRRHIPGRPQTPESEDNNGDPMDWTCAPTPYTSLAAIAVYDEWINRRLDGACNNTIPLTPSVSRVIEKRNKAQNIIVLQGVLSHEELEKRKAEELRKAKHKKEGSQRRVKTLYGVIRKGDALLRIAGRKEYLEQCRAVR
jgi:hypothetical protein